MTGLPWAVYLFDIDGTLVSAGGAGRRAFERAVGDHCEPPAGRLAELRLDGMTDRLIVRETMRLLGRSFDDASCDALLARESGERLVQQQQLRLLRERHGDFDAPLVAVRHLRHGPGG